MPWWVSQIAPIDPRVLSRPRQVEEAAVDRAQFPAQGALNAGFFDAGEGGHAVHHGGTSQCRSAQKRRSARTISMNVSRLAAKAQDCSAVRQMRPNTRCDKGLQAVGEARFRAFGRRPDFLTSAQARCAAL